MRRIMVKCFPQAEDEGFNSIIRIELEEKNEHMKRMRRSDRHEDTEGGEDAMELKMEELGRIVRN
jgi:hypothetical protein